MKNNCTLNKGIGTITTDKNLNSEKREITIILDLFTRIVKKEDTEKCICHPIESKVDNKSIYHENEVISGIQVTQNKDDQIKFEEIICKLRLLGYPITGSLISIYCKKIDDFIYLGPDPLDTNLILDKFEFENLNILKLKISAFIEEKHLLNQTDFGQIFQELNNNGNTKNPPFLKSSSILNDKKSNTNKRTKERKIGYIIEKVNTWRKYYNGYYDEKGNFTKFSLDEAAKKIDISKKSLDDYLLQLRLGRKYGFDFNLHRNDKVGILRAFVKEHRKKISLDK